MSFTFGAAPAPAAGGFSFGASSTPAPSSSGFSFGGGPTAAGPATPNFSFGGASSAPGPAPAPTGFGFGGGAAPASSTFPFGGSSTTAPAPSTGFGFGGSPAPAPSSNAFSFGGGSTAFGSSSPAPSAFGGGAFSSPSPAPFSSPFGAPASSALQPTQTPSISGGTPYSALPQDIRQAIDTIHEAMMKHKRTMINMQSMAPKALLREDTAKMNPRVPGQPAPLAVTIRQLNQSITALEQETGLEKAAESCKADYETLIKQAVMYGQWQIEALAVRRGVHLRPLSNDKKQQQSSQKDGSGNTEQSSAQAQLQAVLDRQMAQVDRLERMPSPYLWQVIEDLYKRLHNLNHYVLTLQQQIQNSLRSEEPADISAIVQSQHRAIFKISAQLSHLHAQVEQLRQMYRFFEKGENVLEKAQYEEQLREQRLNERIQMQYVKAASSSTQAQPGTAPAPGAFGGDNKAPAPSAFSFAGGTPAPASGTSFGFGSSSTTPAPAFSFGANPAPAPTTGGFFNNPTPSTAFGTPATSAPASAFSFASPSTSSSSTPKSSKNKSRNKGRLGR